MQENSISERSDSAVFDGVVARARLRETGTIMPKPYARKPPVSAAAVPRSTTS